MILFQLLRPTKLQGYARVTSALLGPRAIHAAFTSTAAEVCEVTWIKFGEFSKNIFGHMPGIVRSHANGATFHSVRVPGSDPDWHPVLLCCRSDVRVVEISTLHGLQVPCTLITGYILDHAMAHC